MFNLQLFKQLELEDLQVQHRQLADAIGLEAMKQLSLYCGGTQVYIPQPFELAKEMIFRKILEEYAGDNIQQLATKYKVSVSTVYRVVKQKISRRSLSQMGHPIVTEKGCDRRT